MKYFSMSEKNVNFVKTIINRKRNNLTLYGTRTHHALGGMARKS